MSLLRAFFVGLFTATAGPAAAHPHIFVETGLRPVFDAEGRMEGIEVSWRYDEFYSLLLLEDMGLDADADGVLSAGEAERLQRFDQQWVEGFEGDLYVQQGGEPLRLGPPEDRGTDLAEGRITSRHFRRIEGGRAGAAWRIRAYDPGYYTAYDLGLGLLLPEGCAAEIAAPDLGAADRALQAELAKLPKDADAVEMGFPEVGEVFAETVMLRCAGGS